MAGQVTIIGGGLMGAGIAQVFAVAGFDVAVQEPQADIRLSLADRVRDQLQLMGLATDAAERIKVFAELAGAVRDATFVTEAAPERLALKRAIFAELEVHAPPHAILASNSSVIPITHIAEGCATAHRMVGTHWWNPPTLIPLVEVIQGACTSDDTVAATMNLLASAGKQPAHVRRDVPGFVGNRLQHALWREAIAMVAEGVCDAQTLDTCVKSSFGLRLAVLGPLENADLVGLDLTLDIHRTIMPELDRHDRPHEYLESLVASGRCGMKSGEGFRTWTEAEMAAVRRRLVAHLMAAQKPGSA